jgi:hypothetical protein
MTALICQQIRVGSRPGLWRLLTYHGKHIYHFCMQNKEQNVKQLAVTDFWLCNNVKVTNRSFRHKGVRNMSSKELNTPLTVLLLTGNLKRRPDTFECSEG